MVCLEGDLVVSACRKGIHVVTYALPTIARKERCDGRVFLIGERERLRDELYFVFDSGNYRRLCCVFDLCCCKQVGVVATVSEFEIGLIKICRQNVTVVEREECEEVCFFSVRNNYFVVNCHPLQFRDDATIKRRRPR